MDAPLGAAQLALVLGPGLEDRWPCLDVSLRTGLPGFLSAGALGVGHHGSILARALSGVPAQSPPRAESGRARGGAGALGAGHSGSIPVRALALSGVPAQTSPRADSD